jgi:hypothetical protein
VPACSVEYNEQDSNTFPIFYETTQWIDFSTIVSFSVVNALRIAMLRIQRRVEKIMNFQFPFKVLQQVRTRRTKHVKVPNAFVEILIFSFVTDDSNRGNVIR